jgi:hypothetical protein
VTITAFHSSGGFFRTLEYFCEHVTFLIDPLHG